MPDWIEGWHYVTKLQENQKKDLVSKESKTVYQ